MRKEDLIARLKELGTQLGRDVSLSGTNEDLSMRIAELEEELAGDNESVTEEQSGADGADAPADSDPVQTASETSSSASGPAADEKVTVEALVTLHIGAEHAVNHELVVIAAPGTPIRVSPAVAESLIKQSLARPC